MAANQPKLYIWFVDEELHIEFHGFYEPRAPWYRPFMRRLRMELGCKNIESPVGWSHGGGRMAGKGWAINLQSDALRTPQEPQQALQAVLRAVQAFNTYPHNVGMLYEII